MLSIEYKPGNGGRENGVKDREIIEDMLRQIADSTTQEEYESSLNKLVESDPGQKNQKLQHWFNQHWLSIKQVCTYYITN